MESLLSKEPSHHDGSAINPPPPGEPWDLPIAHCPLVFLDLELTGSSPKDDAIIEIALYRERGGIPEGSLISLLSTAIPSSPGALACHHISDEMRANAPTFASIAPRVFELLHGAVPIGHGILLDQECLQRAFAQTSIAAPALDWFLDTDLLARRAINTQSHALSAVSALLALPPRTWHRAGEDAAGVRSLFQKLLPEFAARSARDLWEVRIGQRERVMVRSSIAEQLTALANSHAWSTIVFRTPGRGSTAVRCKVEHWNPPHLHLTMSNGVVRPLRADRILRILPDRLPTR